MPRCSTVVRTAASTQTPRQSAPSRRRGSTPAPRPSPRPAADAYGAEQLYALPEAQLLINVSNDAWFGDSIAPPQHLEIARARAQEAGRYVVRATNTGISGFIGPQGEVLQRAAQFEFASMTMQVTPMQGATPYARTGNLPVVLLALIAIGFGAYRRQAQTSGTDGTG